MANTHSLDLEASSSQYADRADTASLSITGNLTIEAWIKVESTGSENAIFGKYGSTNNVRSYLLELASGNTLLFAASSNGQAGTTVLVTVSFTPTLGQWYHVAVVYTAAAGTADFYVNGVQQGTQQSGLPTSLHDNASRPCIGAYNTDASSGAFFDGLIDEVRVWSTTKTGADILAKYQQELVGDETNLQGYWKLNNAYTDSTANANTLAASGSPVFSTDVPVWQTAVQNGVGFFMNLLS